MTQNEMSTCLVIAKDKALDQAEAEFIEQIKITLLNEYNQATVVASTYIAQHKEKIKRINGNYIAIKDMIG